MKLGNGGQNLAKKKMKLQINGFLLSSVGNTLTDVSIKIVKGANRLCEFQAFHFLTKIKFVLFY